MHNPVSSSAVTLFPILSINCSATTVPVPSPFVSNLQAVRNNEISSLVVTRCSKVKGKLTLQQLTAAIDTAQLNTKVPFLNNPDLNQFATPQYIDVLMQKSAGRPPSDKVPMLRAVQAFPKNEGETKMHYAARLVLSYPGLTRQQAAAAAGISRGTMYNLPELRGETPGTIELRKNPQYPHETNVNYGRRLKRDFPDYPTADYVVVSEAPRSTLLNFPEFQKETIAVKEARKNPDSARKKDESDIQWGERLQNDFDLSYVECSRLTWLKVSVFREARNARIRRNMTEYLLDNINLSGADHGESSSTRLPASSFPLAESSGSISARKVNNIADWMVREPGSFNHELGEQPLLMLLNSEALRTGAVIVITHKEADGMVSEYLRSENSIASLNEIMVHEYKIELIRSEGESKEIKNGVPNSKYNLLHNEQEVPNIHDGDCLFRAIAQSNLLRSQPKLSVFSEAIISTNNALKNSIQHLRNRAADTFISNPGLYLEKLDPVTLARDYAQLSSWHGNAEELKSLNMSATDGSSICDIDTLSASTSLLSLSDTGPSRNKIRRKEKLKLGQSEGLITLHSQLSQVEEREPKDVLQWIQEQQLVGRAAMGIMSAEAEGTGTLVMQEVVTILLLTLENHPELITHVYEVFLPEDKEERAEIVNTIPIIMNRLAGYKMTELIRQLSKNPQIKKDIVESLRQQHIADRPFPLAYIESNNFFGRVNIASKIIVSLIKPRLEGSARNDALNQLLESTTRLFKMSEEKLKAAGLTDNPNWLNVFLSRIKKRDKSAEPVESPPLETDKPKITSEILRQVHEEDQSNFAKYKNIVSIMQNEFSKTQAEITRKSSQSLRNSTSLVESIASANAFALNAHLADISNAEKDNRWEVDKERQWEESRRDRDINNNRLCELATDPVRLGINLAVDGMYQEMQGDVRPSAKDIFELTREGSATIRKYNASIEENNQIINDKIDGGIRAIEKSLNAMSACINELEVQSDQCLANLNRGIQHQYRQIIETLSPVQEFAEREAYVSDNDHQLQQVLAEFNLAPYGDILNEADIVSNSSVHEHQIELLNTISSPVASMIPAGRPHKKQERRVAMKDPSYYPQS